MPAERATTHHVFTVHTVRTDDLGAVEIIFPTEDQARSYARDRSHDFRVLAASVSRYTLGLLGTRTAVTWYAGGAEQPERSQRPGRLYPIDSSIPSYDPAPPGAAPATPPDRPRGRIPGVRLHP